MIGEQRVCAVQEQNICDPVGLNDIIQPVKIIPWVYHNDRIVVRNKVLNKAVGIGILKDQKRSAGSGRRVDLDNRMIAPHAVWISTIG